MSDIKKTALVILIIALLSNTFTQNAYAANEYDHDALMEYEGYGQAMFESVVEQTTFLTGQYTDNKDYVSQSINEIKDYADFWYNEYDEFTSSCYQSSAMSCLGEMVERGGAYALTVGDWIKNLFNDYGEEYPEPEADYSGYEVGLKIESTLLKPKTGYSAQILRPSGNITAVGSSRSFGMSLNSYTINSPYYYSYQFFTGSGYIEAEPKTNATKQEVEAKILEHSSRASTVSGAIGLLIEHGYSVTLLLNNEVVSIDGLDRPPSSRPNIINYINENPIEVTVPQLKPSLVCPDGTRIEMGISGSTFISVNGETMLVNKDGTAEVNGSICNLNWQKPTVEYTPDGDVKITQPDGTESDGMPNFTDLEGCNGAIMCGIAKMLDGLGSVVKSITGLVTSLLDGILALFVPEDLDFMTEEFNNITNKLNDKIAITDSLKEAITGVFDGGGSNPLANISINLPITNEPLTFGNVSFIEEGVPILRRVISAIVVLYTIAYVYRKITGRGGVMER